MTHVKRFFYGSAVSLLTVPALVSAQFDPDLGGRQTGLPGGDGSGVIDIIGNIMQWLLVLVGILAVIAFVISGILYLTSAGNEDQISQAKRAMVWAIVGVIVALLGLIVLNAVTLMLDAEKSF